MTNYEMLRVNVIPVEDSFVHLSSKLIRELNSQANHKHPVCLKVKSIDGVPGEFYASYSQTPYNSNGDDMFNISYELLTTIGFKRSQFVSITVVDQIHLLERVYVTPVTTDDLELLMVNNVSLQDSILQQLQIVQKNKIFPIWVSKFIHLNVFIDDLGNNLQIGVLNESTEIVVAPVTTSPDIFNSIKSIDQPLEDIGTVNQNDFIPITKYHSRFIYRTILVDEILLESKNIYDYCAFVSKSHMSMIFKHANSYSSGNSFVQISLVRELNQITLKDAKKPDKIDQPLIVVRLCPLDPLMINIDKMEKIDWPTIYVTKTLSKMLSLKMNSKVVLEPISEINNEICDVQSIYISPLNKTENVDEHIFLRYTIKRLKNEILLRDVLALNNSSLLKIFYNKVSSMDVLVTFVPSSIPFIYLNDYNFGMITFISKPQTLDTNNKIEVTHNSIFDMSKYYNLQCFREMTKTGSLCLKLGLQCHNSFTQNFFESDNLLITGGISSGKTSTAKLLCHKFSKSPYFVKIIWISGRFLAGKLFETVQKQMINSFQECLYFQPAVMVIDDFDDLCHLNSKSDEQVDMSKIYLRPLHLLMNMIESYTHHRYAIRVICTVKPLNQENENLFTKRLKNVFRTVIDIPVIDKENRKIIISKRLSKLHMDVNDEFLMYICKKMDNYVIQDLIDYCDKVLFEIFKDGDGKILNKKILNNVFEKNVPLSLCNMKFHKEKQFNFSSVGGLTKAKQTITETIMWPSIHCDIFSKCPLKLQSGILLFGAPGTGKTLLAKAIVGESDLNFITINSTEILSKYVGESESSVRKIFQRAQNAKPCILFFDEFESIAPKRGSDQTGVTDRIVNQFLTELDGVDTSGGVWVVIATSRPDIIDQALLRPGRIGVKIHCPIPSISDREDILRILCDKFTLSENINFHNIAVETVNFTGADLYGLLYSALRIAEEKLIKDENDVSPSDLMIAANDFQEALKTTKPSLHQTDIDRYAWIYRSFLGKTFEGDVNNGMDGNIKRQQKLMFA